MNCVDTRAAYYALDLDQPASARVLEQALALRAATILTPRSADRIGELHGCLAEVRGESLFLSVATCLEVDALRSGYCDGRFRLGSDEYLFASSVLDLLDYDGTMLLEISRPRNLQVVQRRRFARARMAVSAPVELTLPGAATGASLSGALLNACQDGIACRVDADQAESFPPGAQVNAAFDVGEPPQRFAFDAVIRSAVAGGTPGALILGLEFEHSEATAEHQARLRAVLARYW